MNATLERKQQERLAYCTDHLTIDTDQYGTFAKVTSATDHNISYRVDIDESHGVPFATHCSCTSSKDECIHYQAVNLFYQRIANIFAKEAIVEAQEVEMEVTPQEPRNVTPLRKMSTVEAGLAPWLKDAMNGRSRNGYLSGKAS